MTKKLTEKNKLTKLTRESKKTPKVTSRIPQTMAELLAQTKSPLRGWKRGDVVEGVVTDKTSRAIYLEIGGKTEGMVIDREMKAARDFIAKLAVGDKVLAVITQPENDRGQILMSLKKAAAENIWTGFEQKQKLGETLKVRGREVNRGGLVVEFEGLQGFIPASQFSSSLSGKINDLIGQELVVKVIELDREKNRLIFSEKEVSDAGLLKEQEKALKKIKVGAVFQGEVTGITSFGLFVRIFTKAPEISLDGLVHISEISWQKVDDPSRFYTQGDKVKVKVLATDKKTGKLNLSIKQLQTDPWEEIEKKYPVDARVKGVVVRIAPFGAFVNLEPGIEGLIHISKIPAEKIFKADDKVDCFIESVDKEARRISLGLVLKEKPVGYK